MIDLEKIKQEKWKPSPLLKRPAPAPYFHPFFYFFSPPPPLGEVMKTYSAPFKKVCVMSGLVPLVTTWNCQTNYKNKYTGLLVLHLLLLLNPWLIVVMWSAEVFSISRYYFCRCSSELAQFVSLPFSQGRSIRYSDRLYDFTVTIPRRCYKDGYVNSFFPQTAGLQNSQPIECFPLTYNLNGFKSRINRHLLTVGSF